MRRVYAKIDVDLLSHPKLAGATAEVKLAFVAMLLHSKKFLTDGTITDQVAEGFAGPEVVTELVDRSLLDPGGGAYRIHDWNDWNETRAQVTARREAERERKRRERGGSTRILGPRPLDPELEGWEEFWEAYPSAYGEADAREAYAVALTKLGAAELETAAARYRDDPNRDAAYTMHAANWLRGERWSDPPLPARLPAAPAADPVRRALEKAAADAAE